MVSLRLQGMARCEKMAFSSAFHLLKNFTAGILKPSPEAISDNDIESAAAYLGMDVSSVDGLLRIERIEAELQEQNRFLTAHLKDDNIDESGLFKRSTFVREVVANNRARKKGRGQS